VKAASLRTKFLLIVLLGAVLPLAVVGWWLTGSAVRSGRALLRGQLDSAVAAIAFDARARWALRAGELRLLANNTVARAALAAQLSRLASADSAYLAQLFTTFHDAIPRWSYVDLRGRARWSFHDPRTAIESALARDRLTGTAADIPGESRASTVGALTFPIELPVESEDGRVVGTLRADVRLSSVLASDSGQRTVPGAAFAVFAAGGLLASTAPDSLDLSTGAAHPSWEIATRSLESPPLRLVLAARAAPFVRPFERAASAGLGVLMGVALIALLVSSILTGRVIGSIERVAVAAERVAAGDLNGTVDVGRHDEIGRLAGAFNAMTESLRRTLAELSQQRALAAVGEFAASLSHEVRNALTAMRIDLQHAVRQLPGDSAAAPLVARTLDTVRRLDSTVTGALRVARSGHATMAPINLSALLQRSMASAEPSFARSGATLAPLGPECLNMEVDGDASALEQLFLNLLLNAAQALHAGGRAQLDVRAEGHSVIVRIGDDGPGFEAGVLPEGVSILHSTKADGTGLGLAIARRIATAHGGELRIESVTGQGAVVVVTLPGGRPQSDSG
jgi:signal transduction histidine kinase